MTQLTCFKCGSKRIDRGDTPLVAVLGGAIIIASVAACCLTMNETGMTGMVMSSDAIDWSTFAPTAHMNCGYIFSLCLGVVMLIQGLQRTERVRCRDCGSVFTPPKPRTVKPNLLHHSR